MTMLPEDEREQADLPLSAEDQEPLTESSSMQALVEFMARNVVTQPEDVAVTVVENKASVVFELRVAADDMGKVIGKDGRVAKAMRTLLKVAAAKERKRAVLEIV